MLKLVALETACSGTVTVIRPSTLDMDPPSAPMVFIIAGPFDVLTPVGLLAALVGLLMNQIPAMITASTTTVMTATTEIAAPTNNLFVDMIGLLTAHCCSASVRLNRCLREFVVDMNLDFLFGVGISR